MAAPGIVIGSGTGKPARADRSGKRGGVGEVYRADKSAISAPPVL